MTMSKAIQPRDKTKEVGVKYKDTVQIEMHNVIAFIHAPILLIVLYRILNANAQTSNL